jgi:hypothetical protein
MSETPTPLGAVKIQAHVVIPIVRALEQEIGPQRAHSMVGQVIAGPYAQWQAKTESARQSHPRDVNIQGQYPVKTEVVEDTDSTFAAEAVLRPDWEFHRTQTLMGGASYCDFRWRLRDVPERGASDE